MQLVIKTDSKSKPLNIEQKSDKVILIFDIFMHFTHFCITFYPYNFERLGACLKQLVILLRILSLSFLRQIFDSLDNNKQAIFYRFATSK